MGSRETGMVFLYNGRNGPRWRVRLRGRRHNGEAWDTERAVGRAWLGGGGRRPPGSLTRKEAQMKADELAAELLVGVTAAPLALRFDRAAESWFESRRNKNLKPSTLRTYRSDLDNRILPRFGAQRIDSIDSTAVGNWIRDLRRDGLSARSINKLRRMVNGVYVHAARTHPNLANPISSVDNLRVQTGTHRRVYTPDEALLLVRSARSPRDRALLATAVMAGLRLGEIRALQWGNIDLLSKRIEVTHSYSGSEILSPKSGKPRVVPINDELLGFLAAWKDVAPSSDVTSPVFIGDLGGPIDQAVARKIYHRACDSAGLERYRFHDLRHTFGSIAIRTANVVEVMHWMGHSRIETTAIYLQYLPQHDAAQRLSDAWVSESSVDASGDLKHFKPMA